MALLDEVFPPSPPAVPKELTAPSRAYRRHAWIATLGLLTFLTLYLGLTGYFAWVVNRLLVNALLHHGNVVGAFFLSLPALFFLAFLVRGLFVVKRAKDPDALEVTEQEQPLLFSFLHRLAAEAGAPRPHRVYLSARVNACVFYDLSFWNLLVPSKKNLELGLGLVNALSLDELKAVVAHEYGHFAQRTMAVGRWVYISQQIAGHVIVSRGIFDRFLAGLSRSDIRIGWIGWIMRLFVWAVRAVLDTGYRLVVIAHRALSREMELQADRVAVAVSGSDSLVHALHRLGPADEAWDEAIGFVVHEANAGRKVDDLFALQTSSLDHLRRVLSEPDLGKTPRRPDDAAGHRVFDVQLAQPPRMWLTHPPNRDREESAKATYVPSALDPRDAWALFSDVPGLRAKLTAQLMAKLELGEEKPGAGTPLDRLAERYARPSLDPRYHGVYLGRSVAAHEKDVPALFGPALGDGREGVLDRLRQLYPDTLRADLKSYRERREEEHLLEGLADGVLTAPGGVIRYKGREIRRKELPDVIARVHGDRVTIEKRVLEHDKRCRAAHRDAAQLHGQGWPEYHAHLVALLHFATHQARSVSDAHSYLHHVLAIVLADGRVSGSERRRLLEVASELRTVLSGTWDAKDKLKLPADVEARFTAAGGWSALGEPLGLGLVTPQNLGDWLNLCDGWANAAARDLRSLADVTLDRLLEVEQQLSRALEQNETLEPAPAPGTVPPRYDTCLVGGERARQKRLGWWDRFQTADGVVPGTLRAAVASLLLAPALFVGAQVGSSTLHVVNGLDVPLRVSIGDRDLRVEGLKTTRLDLGPQHGLHVVAKTLNGQLVEEFDTDIGGGLSNLAYNVAAAVPLVHWTAVYGPARPEPVRELGTQRWLDADEDVIFTRPPTTVSTSHGEGATRTVLQAVTDSEPVEQLGLVKDPAAANAMISAHVRFDEVISDRLGTWLALAEQRPELHGLVAARAAAEPKSVLLQRGALDAATDEERAKLCEAIARRAQTAPDDGDAAYLAVRCEPKGPARDADFAKAYVKHPKNGWLAFAVTEDLAQQGRWKEALDAWSTALHDRALRSFDAYIELETERTRRAAEHAGERVGPQRSVAPGQLKFELRAEGPNEKDDGLAVVGYRLLLAGKLDAAVKTIAPEGRPRLTALAAASDGASDALVKQAGAAVDEETAAALAGLAVRRGESPEEQLKKAGLPEELATASPKQLAALAEKLPLKQRGLAYVFGLVALQNKAPAAWRDEVKALLFPSERPYFH